MNEEHDYMGMNINEILEETDRLTDENRRLRAKVDELESKVAYIQEVQRLLTEEREAAMAKTYSLTASLAERDSEIAKLRLKLTNAGWQTAVLGETPAPDYVTRAEMVKVLRRTALTGIAADLLERLEFAP